MKYVGIFTAFLFIAIVIVAGGNSRQGASTQPSAEQIASMEKELRTVPARSVLVEHDGSLTVIRQNKKGILCVRREQGNWISLCTNAEDLAPKVFMIFKPGESGYETKRLMVFDRLAGLEDAETQPAS